MENSAKKRVMIFIVFLAALSPGSYFIPDGSNLKMLLIMWIPAIAALFTALVTGLSLKSMGWSFSFKWIAAGWLIPVGYGLLTYGLIWLTGLGDVPNPTFLERARFTMGMSSENDMLIITSAFFYITIVNLIPNLVFAFGEELGWRGFLVPQLSRFTGFWLTALLSGLIWLGWHLPGILAGSYGASGTPLYYQVICFSLLILAGSVIFAWIRLRSNSIWPAVVLHATHNGVIQAFFERITLDNGNTGYYAGEFGIVLPLVSLVIALYLLNKEKAFGRKPVMPGIV